MLLQNLTWTAVSALSPDTPIVLPIAALEQHGHHLPVFTDSMLVGEVVRRASEKYQDNVVFGPVMWLGNSHHHIDFAGTMSAPARVYLDMLNGMVDNMLTHGFRRILLLNGHGGNIVPGQQATFEIRQRNRHRADLLLLFASYWDLANPAEDKSVGFVQNRVGHACEFETSMVQRLNPQTVVGDVTKLETIDFGKAFEPGYRGWITKDRTDMGHIGSPQFATAEKGEILFQKYATGLGAYLDRILAWDGKHWNG